MPLPFFTPKKMSQPETTTEEVLINAFSKLSVGSETKTSKFSGTHPNTKWKSISFEQVQQMFPSRYLPLRPLDESEPVTDDNCFLVPQRSKRWHELRSNRITASNLSRALGMFNERAGKKLGLSKTYLNSNSDALQCKLFKSLLTVEELKNVFGLTEDEISTVKSNPVEDPTLPETITKQVFMDWGTNHELNCVATFLFDFDMESDSIFCETGFYTITKPRMLQILSENDLSSVGLTFESIPPLGSSPDGLLKHKNEEFPHSSVEIKCPTSFVPQYVRKGEPTPPSPVFCYLKKKPHEEVPVHYLPQIYAHMLATNTKQCYYMSWTVTCGCKVYRVEFNKTYCLEMLYWLSRFYQCVKSGQEIDMVSVAEDERYVKFLGQSLELAHSAPLVEYIEKSLEISDDDPEKKHMFN